MTNSWATIKRQIQINTDSQELRLFGALKTTGMTATTDWLGNHATQMDPMTCADINTTKGAVHDGQRSFGSELSFLSSFTGIRAKRG